MGDERALGGWPGSSRSYQCLCFPRFDLMGLSPDAPEDEAGIKKAAENSKAPAPLHPPSSPSPLPGKCWAVPLSGPLPWAPLVAFPPPSHTPSPQ